jgi:hypothetical protein
MGPSLLVSEPAGVVSGVFFGAVVFFIARACGLDHTWATVLACIFHFVANTLIAGHINLALVGGVANGAVKVSPSDSGSPSCRRGKRFGAILSRRDPSVASGALRSHKGVSSAMARERLRPARIGSGGGRGGSLCGGGGTFVLGAAAISGAIYGIQKLAASKS